MARSKAPAASDGSFPFVISQGPKPPEDPAVRTMIRRQAMKDVGLARRRKGNYGRANAGQPISFADTNCPKRSTESNTASQSTSSASTSSSASPETSHESTLETASATDYEDVANSEIILRPGSCTIANFTSRIPVTLSTVSAYERVRFQYGVDLSMLTILTNFNIGKSAITALASDPTRLPSLLLLDPQYSYLDFVPSRYDSSTVLAAATDCVLANVKAALNPSALSDATAQHLYGRALRTLQGAITDPSSSGDADVLCAIQMMSIHELLDPSRDAAWSQHIAGSSRLVRHRSSKQFNTEYEKALFAGHVGPAVSEALFNNRSCYLEASEWTALYQSTVQETQHLTERSELVINARQVMFVLPRLWHDVAAVLMSEDLYDDDILAALEKRCRAAHASYLDWLEQYKAHCVARSLVQPSQSEIDLRRETFGAVLECLVIVKRLIESISDSDRSKIELEAQAVAKLIVDLQDQPMPKHSWLFAGHELGVAQVCLATSEHFERDYSGETWEGQRLAMRNRYMAFSGTLRDPRQAQFKKPCSILKEMYFDPPEKI